MRWDQIGNASFTIKNFPDYSVEEAGNKCRLVYLDGKKTPWCYTAQDKTWEYCPVLECEHICMYGTYGQWYAGHDSETISGQKCQKWSEDVPHNHTFKLRKQFPNKKINQAYCRNPILSQTRPWCFTTNTSLRYEACNVPTCPDHFDVFAGRVDDQSILDQFKNQERCFLVKDALSFDTFSGSYLSKVCMSNKTDIFACFRMEGSAFRWKYIIINCDRTNMTTTAVPVNATATTAAYATNSTTSTSSDPITLTPTTSPVTTTTTISKSLTNTKSTTSSDPTTLTNTTSPVPTTTNTTSVTNTTQQITNTSSESTTPTAINVSSTTISTTTALTTEATGAPNTSVLTSSFITSSSVATTVSSVTSTTSTTSVTTSPSTDSQSYTSQTTATLITANHFTTMAGTTTVPTKQHVCAIHSSVSNETVRECSCRREYTAADVTVMRQQAAGSWSKLLTNGTNLTRYKRQYYSVPDHRPSSVGIGTSSLLLLFGLIAFVTFADLSRMVRWISLKLRKQHN
ncbi:uncharacterized threonine-rich GPI-anchored glycoprotein PJ4664.02-like [Gigantopelta aegis]|uniref:uncharacterized threonine-rich GPI-anchored glycoprotein PJ4664.02-like n=1 Tax=Gigantopelta aegis TaxID=1735272 RepID=UPI001B8882DD|nr:uncharacterized threonine-rich GPI-anchored glycoprotein PJ4664.02-like [Gigantopelta aegis]